MTISLTVLALAIPMIRQTLTVECPTRKDAERLTASIVELAPGEKYLWSSRWDDWHQNQPLVAERLNAVGMPTTSYINGKPTPAAAACLREMVGAGNAIGVHTISHKLMDRLLPTKCFDEILSSRIALEIASQSPVIAFAAPYGMNNFGCNSAIIGQALLQSGLLGGADNMGMGASILKLKKEEWAGAPVYSVNDNQPDEQLFERNFTSELKKIAAGKNPAGPHFTLGVHPWQNAVGRTNLAEWVRRKLAATPGLKTLNENEWITRRVQFLHSQPVKTSVSGSKVTFELKRPSVSYLGAIEPIQLALSDGRVLAVMPPEDEILPRKFLLDERALTMTKDATGFNCVFKNSTSRNLELVTCTFHLPVGFMPATEQVELKKVAPGETRRFSAKVKVPEDPIFTEGELVAAVEMNFPGTRIWAPLRKRLRPAKKLEVPRDQAIACGPYPAAEAPTAAEVMAWSRPGVSLKPVAGNAWQRCDIPEPGDAPWAVVARNHKTRISIPWGKKTPANGKDHLVCFDFDADTQRHGNRWKLAITGAYAYSGGMKLYLNGREIAAKGGEVELLPGANRLIANEKLLYNMEAFKITLSLKSVKDGSIPTFKVKGAN